MYPYFKLRVKPIFSAKDDKLSTSLWPSAVFDSTNNIKLRYYVVVKIFKFASDPYHDVQDGRSGLYLAYLMPR